MTQSSNVYSTNIIVSSGKIWRWQLQIIESLKSLGLIDVKQVISNDESTLSIKSPYKWLHQCDAKIFRSPLDAFEMLDAGLLLADEQTNNTQAVPKPDILINFSETKVDPKLLNSFSKGMLEAHFSVNGVLKSETLAINEYLEGLKQVYIAISFTDCDGRSRMIQESRPSLDKGSLSRNLNQYIQLLDLSWQRAIKKVADGITLAANTAQVEVLDAPSINTTSPVLLAPKLCQRFGRNVVDKLLQKYKQNEQWVLLLKFLEQGNLEKAPLDFNNYIELIPPADVFWADPFVVTEDGRYYVFFEELPFETERGHLSCMEVFKDGLYSQPKTILKQPYHLSFPNIFKYESSYYMIPESGDHGEIELYSCSEFPYKWEKKHTLIEGLHAYDSTLIEHDDRWWLFATVAAKKGMSGNEELHIFYADSPISSDWVAHKANPVICDASTARPAGQFFKKDGEWYRPSQDCAGHYGAGLNINKVMQLDTETYLEQKVEVCRPDWKDDLIALHTLNFNDDFAVADALRVTDKGVF